MAICVFDPLDGDTKLVLEAFFDHHLLRGDHPEKS